MRPMKTTTLFLLTLAAYPWLASAQSYDPSGNSKLKGTYYFRQVIYVAQSSQAPEGTVGQAVNMQGIITFDGGGNYTFANASLLDSSVGTVSTGLSGSGTYAISAGGEGYITAVNPEVSTADQIVGLVSNGIFIGSSTENTEGYNDLFIAAPVGAPIQTNSTLNGTYQVAYMDPTVPEDAIFALNANGSGGVGTVNITGYIGTATGATGQTLNNVTYSFSNGAAQLAFGGTASNTTLITGTELLYTTPDGKFIFGGNYNGYDMFVGVLAATGTPANYNGLYYQAGIDMDESTIGNGYVLLDSYYGSIDLLSGGNIIGDQRLNLPLAGVPEDYTYFDNYTLGGNGSSSDSDYNQTYWSSADGSIRIGYGVPDPSIGFDMLGINVALQAPTLTGSGVFLNPNGMVNAASSAPFTTHLSPGEFLTLYGTGLAPSAASAPSLPLPTNLNGVQVSINDIPAPINYVSPTQISVVVPFLTTQAVAQIQVTNNGSPSNMVTQFVGSTSAGVFTYDPEGGIGFAAAEDTSAGYSVVSTTNPAQIGDTVAVYLAGLGLVTPTVGDGTAAPSSPLSTTTDVPLVYIDDTAGNQTQATVTYHGLAPGFAGLYQINLTVPSGVASGTASLEIVGTDSDTVESGFPVGTPSGDAVAAHSKSPGQQPRVHHHVIGRRAIIGLKPFHANQVSANQP